MVAPMVCEIHGVETRLRCASCERPICLRCQVRTDAGLKCPSCAAAPSGAARATRRRGLPWAALGAGAVVVLVALVVLTLRTTGSSSSRSPHPGAPPVGHWFSLRDLTSLRGGTTAVVLGTGRVLAVGGGVGSIPLAGTEVYDPASRRSTSGGELHEGRRGNATVLLADGRVLTAGGIASGGRVLASAELWDPSSGGWTLAAPMHEARFNHTLTRLADGSVLAAGGIGTGGAMSLGSAELYEPGSDSWTLLSRPMVSPRSDHVAALLEDGRVLLAGGAQVAGSGTAILDSAELFDPAARVFTRAGSMRERRQDPTATRLLDGRVLITGGATATASLITAEIFDPMTGGWSATGPMSQSRRLAAASLLPDGSVLVTGGELVENGSRTSLTSAELYIPAAGGWRPAASLHCPRSAQAQVTLEDGSVLVIAGDAAFPGQPPRAQSCLEIFRSTAGR